MDIDGWADTLRRAPLSTLAGSYCRHGLGAGSRRRVPHSSEPRSPIRLRRRRSCHAAAANLRERVVAQRPRAEASALASTRSQVPRRRSTFPQADAANRGVHRRGGERLGGRRQRFLRPRACQPRWVARAIHSSPSIVTAAVEPASRRASRSARFSKMRTAMSQERRRAASEGSAAPTFAGLFMLASSQQHGIDSGRDRWRAVRDHHPRIRTAGAPSPGDREGARVERPPRQGLRQATLGPIVRRAAVELKRLRSVSPG